MQHLTYSVKYSHISFIFFHDIGTKLACAYSHVMDQCLYDISEWEWPQEFLNVGHQVVNHSVYIH